jgi:putative endonuclease
MAQWSVYIVRCSDGALYTGVATDVRRRIAEHAQNNGRGAKYLRGKGPLQLVFARALGSRDLALRVESQIKKLPKVQKEELIDPESGTWVTIRARSCSGRAPR